MNLCGPARKVKEPIMYEEFYGLSKLPFQLLPDPDFFYRSQKHEKALTCLEFGVFERAGFIVITGEIGTGKTMLLRYLLRSLSKDLPIALLNQTFLSPEDFLRTLCREFLLPYEAKEKSELLELLSTFLVDQYQEGRYVILILDEAQNLPLDTLEEIRMLSNLDADSERLLQIILLGQPLLRSKLQREELRQLLQRVEVSYHLQPLDRGEIQEYIRHRLATAGAEDHEIFDDSAMEAIFECTGGVPRLINLICHRCLVYGFAESRKKITRDLLENMLEDRRSEGLYPEAIFESVIPSQEATDGASDIKQDSEHVISPIHFTASLKRLTEISAASMKAVELAAAKAANRTDEENLALLKKELTEERKLRQALEHRLARAEDDLSQLVNPPSEMIPEDQKRHSANTWSSLTVQKLRGLFGFHRFLFSVEPSRRIIFLLVLIIVVSSSTGLALWRLKGSKINEKPVDRESAGFKFEMHEPDAKAEGRTPIRKPQEKPLAAEADSAGKNPEARSENSEDFDNQTGINRENTENLRLPVKTAPSIVTGKERAFPERAEPENYVCAVELANVRAEPDIKAPIVQRIGRGTKVEVIGEHGDWMQLKSDSGRPAWIYGTLLRREK